MTNHIEGHEKATLPQQAPSTAKAASDFVDIPLKSELEPSDLTDKKGHTSSMRQPVQQYEKVGKMLEDILSLPRKIPDNNSANYRVTNCEKDGEEIGKKKKNSSTLVKTPIIITRKEDAKPATLKIEWGPLQQPATTNQETPKTKVTLYETPKTKVALHETPKTKVTLYETPKTKVALHETPKTKVTLSKSSLSNLKTEGNKTAAVNSKKSVKKPYTCATCKRQFVTAQLIEKHKLEEHGAVDKYKCRLCCMTYRRKRGLSMHMRRDHPGSQNAPHQCALCELAFPDKGALKKHARAKHELRYTCEFCNRVFWNKALLNKHIDEIHIKNEDGTVTNPGFECGSCKQVFATLRAHKNHVNAFCKNSMTEEKPFSCTKCDATFQNHLLLKRHYIREHNERIDPRKMVASHKCHLCSKTFISPSALQLHACHRPCQQFKCQHCGKRYKNNSALTEHVEVVHSGKKPEYPCKQCGEVFNRLSSLRCHEREHVNGKKMYECAFCPKEYASNQSVRDHERKHRGESVLCPQCGKTFASMQVLGKHNKMVHMNKKNYVCTICSKAYYDSYKLRCHMDSHMGYKNHKCRYCDKKFTYSSSKLKHQKTQHPEEYAAFLIKFRERNKVEVIQPGEVVGDDGVEGLEREKTDGAAEIAEDSKELEINQNYSSIVTKETSINKIEETKSRSEMDDIDKFEDAEMLEEEDSCKDIFFEQIDLGKTNSD